MPKSSIESFMQIGPLLRWPRGQNLRIEKSAFKQYFHNCTKYFQSNSQFKNSYLYENEPGSCRLPYWSLSILSFFNLHPRITFIAFFMWSNFDILQKLSPFCSQLNRLEAYIFQNFFFFRYLNLN